MKTLKYFIPVVLAFVVIAGCQKETVSKDEVKGEELCVTVTADVVETSNENGSKTAMVDDGVTPYAKWLSTDEIKLWEFMDGEKKNYFQTSSTTLSPDEKTATFTLSTYGKAEGGTTYTYTAIYPANGVAQSENFFYFEIPANQTLSGTNFDPNADVMIGKPLNRDSRLTELENLNFQFKRPGTVVKLTIKGIWEGEKISSITVTAPENIAGRCKVDMLTGVVSDKAYYGGTNKISLSCDDVVATGSDVFFFRCLDGTWAQGAEVSIKVTTDVAEYSKTSTLPKDYVFADGGLTRFGFKDLTRKAGLDTYVKYTDELIDGDYIICSGTSAMKNVISSDRMTIETVTVTDDKIQTNDASKVWHIEESGSYWTLYNADVKQYASSTGVKNKMALSDNKGDDKSLWTASYNSNSEWEFVNKQNSTSSVNANLRCNGNLGFACYSTSTGSSLTLYINSSDLKDPLSTPVIDVTGDNFAKTISVEWDAVSNATGYEVSCTGKDNISTTGTSCQFTGLAAGEYSITVKAVDNTGKYRASKTTEDCTLYDPTVTLSTTSVINVPAAGDIRSDVEYSLSHADETDWTWTCDGTIVSDVDADEGTVTYTVEANTTDNARDGWIKVTLNGVEQTITVSQLAQGGKQDQTITFSQASYSVKMGETITQTVSGAMTTVTYSSSDTAIATVDQDGKVTPVASGSCTIYADAAEDATYNTAQTSYELTVQASTKTWTYTVSTDSPKLNASNPATVNGATWSIVMGTKVGSPTTDGVPTNSYSKCGWKWGNSSSKYWKSYTLSTDYFTEKKVSKVTVKFLNNGSKSATMTIMQGTTTIGTDTKTFGTTWTDLSANAKQGTSGTLTIQYSVEQASLINSITVEYLD